MEIGSGIGLLSAAILTLDVDREIKGIIAIEASLPFVETGINITRNDILRTDKIKLLPCYGSFDSMDIESESFDFIVQNEALHHADSLQPPSTELFRILKKDGQFVSVDQSWPDNTNSDSLI